MLGTKVSQSKLNPGSARSARNGSGNATSQARGSQPVPATAAGAAVKELIRALGVAAKNYQLYPTHGRVVAQSLSALLDALNSALQAAGSPIEILVTQQDLIFREEIVYHEEARGTSLANRLHTDTVRKLTFVGGVTSDELTRLLGCFREARVSLEDGDDFSTIFWAKDIQHISIETADDFTTEEALALLPVSIDGGLSLDSERFKLSEAEETSLREALANRQETPQGDSTFELTPEELSRIQELISAEENYFPLYDFIDLLFEHMARSRDSVGFQGVVKVVVAILEKMIGSFDFEHALGLMHRLFEPRKDDPNRNQYTVMATVMQGLSNQETFAALGTFLKETPHLPHDHEVFRFMQTLGINALPNLCGLLTHVQHASAVADVLIALGSGCGDVFSQFLTSQDSQVARSIVQVILKTDRRNAVERVAQTLRHPDENVRLHAARALLEHGDERAAPFFLKILKGESGPLVLIAIQFFAKVASPVAFEELRHFIESKRFAALDNQRQELIFKAFVLANSSSAFRYLAEVVLKWRITLGKNSVRKKAAALRALALYREEPAIAILRRFSNSGISVFAQVARRVLDMIEHESPLAHGSARIMIPPGARPEKTHG